MEIRAAAKRNFIFKRFGTHCKPTKKTLIIELFVFTGLKRNCFGALFRNSIKLYYLHHSQIFKHNIYSKLRNTGKKPVCLRENNDFTLLLIFTLYYWNSVVLHCPIIYIYIYIYRIRKKNSRQL